MNKSLKKGAVFQLIGYGKLPRAFIQKLYGLGLHKGATFSITHIAPLGCPVALQVGNTLLSLRVNEINQMRLEHL